MKRQLVVVAMLLTCLGMTQSAFADELTIKAEDTIQKILENYKGKPVTLRLSGGAEMTGKVRIVTKKLVQLGELSGRDYFDGIIEIDKISAIVVNAKKQ